MLLLTQVLQVSDVTKSAFFSLRQWQGPRTNVSKLGSPDSWPSVWSPCISAEPSPFPLHVPNHPPCPLNLCSLLYVLDKANRNAQGLDDAALASRAFLTTRGAGSGAASQWSLLPQHTSGPFPEYFSSSSSSDAHNLYFCCVYHAGVSPGPQRGLANATTEPHPSPSLCWASPVVFRIHNTVASLWLCFFSLWSAFHCL